MTECGWRGGFSVGQVSMSESMQEREDTVSSRTEGGDRSSWLLLLAPVVLVGLMWGGVVWQNPPPISSSQPLEFSAGFIPPLQPG